MKTLTREQAIKRIRDISDLKQDEHFMIRNQYDTGFQMVVDKTKRAEGAILELMAIFDIKEEEL